MAGHPFVNELFANTDPTGVTDLEPEVGEPDYPLAAQAAAAWEVEQRIKGFVRAIRTTWIRLAEDLYRFHELDMWRDLGYSSFDAWTAGPEIDLSRRQVYNLIMAWREFVVVRGVLPGQLEDVAISKVPEVMPALRRGQVDVAGALADCRTLAREDLRQRYAGVGTKPGRPDTSSSLDAEAEPAYAICPSCGSRYKVAA